jgi:hypothetical protein
VPTPPLAARCHLLGTSSSGVVRASSTNGALRRLAPPTHEQVRGIATSVERLGETMRRVRLTWRSCRGPLVVGLVLSAPILGFPQAAFGGEKPLPASPHPRRNLPHGLLPAWRQVHDHLALKRTTVVTGTTIDGTLIVVNAGKRPIDLKTRCRPKFEVAVMSPSYTPQVAFRATCNGRPFIIKPGENRLPVKVFTTYLSCSPQTGTAFSTIPACTASGPPPLRTGRYRTVLEGTGLALPQPKPVVVSLVS